jgi:hypothetical protein
VIFASRRARAIWAGLGLLLGLAGYLLVAPALESRPPPPRPWGLWFSTDALDKQSYPRPTSWLLRLWVKADRGCGEPVAVRGEILIANPYQLARSPRTAVLSVAGARVLDAEIKGISNLRSWRGSIWRPMAVARSHEAYVAQAPLFGRLEPNLLGSRAMLFRLSLEATRGAGYAACSMTSPALFGLPGDDALWDLAETRGKAFMYRREGVRMSRPPLTDAIVRMSVPGRTPDRSELDAGAVVHGGSVLLTCEDGFNHFLPREAREDEFFYLRTLAAEPSCASVQTFRTSDSSEDLNRRLFLAGLLLSAAVAMLLEAVALGRTEPA